jgi:membrane protein
MSEQPMTSAQPPAAGRSSPSARQAAGGPPVAPEQPALDSPASGRSRVRAVRDTGTAAVARVQAGAPGRYWSQLTAVDFMNSSFAFAALAVLCAFPLLAVVSAASGGDVREAIVTRMGLDHAAQKDVNGLIYSGHEVSTLTVFGAVLLLVGAIGMASTLQAWYQRIYEQPPVAGLLRHVGYQLAGVVAFCIYISAEVQILTAVRSSAGVIPVFALEFVFATLFWWCSAYFLLFRRVPWRRLLPAGVATGAFITGLGVFSALLFSEEITSGEASYGPAGVVVAVTSYLVGFGVCLHLGAVFGRVWDDWRTSREPLERRTVEVTARGG